NLTRRSDRGGVADQITLRSECISHWLMATTVRRETIDPLLPHETLTVRCPGRRRSYRVVFCRAGRGAGRSDVYFASCHREKVTGKLQFDCLKGQSSRQKPPNSLHREKYPRRFGPRPTKQNMGPISRARSGCRDSERWS